MALPAGEDPALAELPQAGDSGSQVHGLGSVEVGMSVHVAGRVASHHVAANTCSALLRQGSGLATKYLDLPCNMNLLHDAGALSKLFHIHRHIDVLLLSRAYHLNNRRAARHVVCSPLLLSTFCTQGPPLISAAGLGRA